MKVGERTYSAFLTVKAVAFAWIGALLFPMIVLMPIDHGMFWVCLGAGFLALLSVIEGIRAWRKSTSDFYVRAIVPVTLLLISTGWLLASMSVGGG